MELGNPFEIVVHHFLIRGITGLSYWDEFPMVSAIVCINYTLDKTYDES